MRVFLDANIFFAAVKSSSGGSYYILELAKQRHFTIVTVAYALAEAEKNISQKIGKDALSRHYENILAVKPVVQSLSTLSESMKRKLLVSIAEKDVPILAGALLEKVEMLVTLDKKDFIANPKIAKLNLPFKIGTPGDFLQKYII